MTVQFQAEVVDNFLSATLDARLVAAEVDLQVKKIGENNFQNGKNEIVGGGGQYPH